MRPALATRLGLALLAVALGAASAPAGALAAGTGQPAATTPTATALPVVATPVRLQLAGLFAVGHERVTVPGREVVVSGSVTGFAPGQRVELSASAGGRVFRRVTLTLVRRGLHGHFATVLRAPRAGRVRVRVAHARDPAMLSFVRSASFAVLGTHVAPGARGAFVDLLQQRLAALHIFLARTGVYDSGTELAIDTYNRLLGRGEGHTTLRPAALTDLLDGVGRFRVRYPGQGRHAEGDLSDQVLAFINGSRVQWLFPISSGKPSTPTVLGRFQVYLKVPYYTPDGMYFSSFFYSGYAIHGYDPAPDYPASHGCMRLPMADAIPAYDWLKLGDWVDTYYT